MMDDFPPPDAVLLGGPVSRISVSVRISGHTLDPEELTRTLRVSPTLTARKGDTRQSGGRTVTQPVGIWTFALTGEPSGEWELDDAVAAVLAHLPQDLDLWRQLAAAYRLDVFCGLFMGGCNQGADLRPETLRLLAERGLQLSLDIYGPPPGDEDLDEF